MSNFYDFINDPNVIRQLTQQKSEQQNLIEHADRFKRAQERLIQNIQCAAMSAEDHDVKPLSQIQAHQENTSATELKANPAEATADQRTTSIIDQLSFLTDLNNSSFGVEVKSNLLSKDRKTSNVDAQIQNVIENLQNSMRSFSDGLKNHIEAELKENPSLPDQQLYQKAAEYCRSWDTQDLIAAPIANSKINEHCTPSIIRWPAKVIAFLLLFTLVFAAIKACIKGKVIPDNKTDSARNVTEYATCLYNQDIEKLENLAKKEHQPAAVAAAS